MKPSEIMDENNTFLDNSDFSDCKEKIMLNEIAEKRLIKLTVAVDS